MKKMISFLLLVSGAVAFADPGVVAHVNLSPAGNFEAKSSQVTGTATVQGDSVSAPSVKIPVSSLATGIDLRDKHMKEKYLEMAKYPDIELTNAKGSGGKGSGTLKMHGVEQPVSGTYQVIGGKEVEAKFPIKLSAFKIEGIRYMGIGVKDDVDVTVRVPIKK